MNVIIPTHGSPDLLKRTLASLSQSHLPKSLDSIYVVENGSDAGARGVCDGFVHELPLKYIHFEAAGKNRALDKVIRQIETGLLVFFDDDVRIAENTLLEYEKAATVNGAGSFFGGPLLVDSDVNPPNWAVEWLPNSAKGWEPENSEEPLLMNRNHSSKPVYRDQFPYSKTSRWFIGPNLAAFAEDILGLGGFSFHFGPGSFVGGTENNPTGSEDEIQRRLDDAGCKPVYVSEAKVWHHVPASCYKSDWILHRHYRNTMNSVLRGCMKAKPKNSVIFKKCLKYGLKYVMSTPGYLVSFFVQDDERRFNLRRGTYKSRGKIMGYRLYKYLVTKGITS